MLKFSELIMQGTMGYVALAYYQTTGGTSPSLALDDYIPLTFNSEIEENMEGYSLSGNQQITLRRGTYMAYMCLGSYSTQYFSGGLAIVPGSGDPDESLVYSSNALEEGYTKSGAQTLHIQHFRLDEETIIEMFISTSEAGTMTRNVSSNSLNEYRYFLTLVRMM